MEKTYILKEKNGNFKYNEAEQLDNPAALEILSNELRIKILKVLEKKPMYPAELAKELKLHEQKIYYHIKQMTNAGILEIVEKKEIRGTIAKKYKPKNMNFCVALKDKWKDGSSLVKPEVNKALATFFAPFIKDNNFTAKFVVGSPDPHGPYKARARDGHYAIDLALYLGKLCVIPDQFSISLDVDIKAAGYESESLIVVGGPKTNLIASEINKVSLIKFEESQGWALVSNKSQYTDEATGIISRVPNPYNPDSYILLLAGVSTPGSKAAVIALTRYTREVLARFSGQKSFSVVVQGFDLDGDGKIDSIEVLE